VRALEEARRQVINSRDNRDVDNARLWNSIGEDILQELGSGQLRLVVEPQPEDAAGCESAQELSR